MGELFGSSKQSKTPAPMAISKPAPVQVQPKTQESDFLKKRKKSLATQLLLGEPTVTQEKLGV
jgi:hypothetical protein